MSFTLETDLDWTGVRAGVSEGGERGMKLAVEHLLTEANKGVPHDEGTLERSGDTGVAVVGGRIVGSVSYDTPYAIVQHEDMTLSHDGKGRPKWLEVTLSREGSTVARIIATAARRELGS